MSRCCHNSPLELIPGLLPGGPPHARLAAACSRRCPIEYPIARYQSHWNPTLNSRSGLPGFRTAPHDTGRQRKAVLIRDERDMRPCFDNAQDFRARISKIHKGYWPAMKIADVGVPYDENAQRRDGAPVYKLVCNVLMSRAEFKSRIKFPSAAQRRDN